MSDALLMYASPEASADLFHAVPAGITDKLLYAEVGGRRAAMVSVLDADRVRAHGVEALDPSTLGSDELVGRGLSRAEAEVELALRACRALGVARALVPPDFPLAVADHLRGGGVELVVDATTFADRRRAKTPGQIEGIRRAQKAADIAMGVAAGLIHALEDGLTSEQVRAAMKRACDEHGCDLPEEVVVSHGAQSASAHDSGSGEILRGEAVVVDIWPRDRVSRCFADMTRTFVAGGGEPTAELAEFWRLCKASLDLVLPEIGPGGDCKALYARSCEPFHAAGQPTQLSKAPGTVLDRGFFHSLGHGVGLELHEGPILGRGDDVLRPGDVVSVEPGCYLPGVAGCRLEDLVLITEDGCENLTDFPYDL
jgi:Xaa-Pro aminopeptidase